MKKVLLFFAVVFLCFGAIAQNIDKTAALQLIIKNKAALGLSTEDISNAEISSTYFNSMSGTQLVYLQQTHKGIQVFNQIQTLAFKNGTVVSSAGTRIKDIEKITEVAALPAISAEAAVRTAMADKKISIPALPRGLTGTGNKIDFGKPAGITHENITAELVWTPLNNGKQVRLTWQVYLVPNTTSDYWLIRVDALTNKVVDENNLTVYCNWGDGAHQHDASNTHHTKQPSSPKLNTPDQGIVNSASYLVIPYPAESPIHPGGTPALRSDPWNLSAGNATSLKWHSDGTNDYTYTRGNNAWAYHDRLNNNAGDPTRSAQSSTTPDPLTFDFTPDFTQAPTLTTPANQQFNITNLFYWNNIQHDLMYLYGFNEVAGNFQVNNQGRGGIGNDYVRAEAQDGSGTNNANFSTPVDGGLPRMQMFLWTAPNPDRDGDVDNGIILHEGGHGVSNRLTGGPATTSCLGNAEQMGEGWSDYLGLMATHNWATAITTDGFTNPRGVGTYALNQPITGVGIRQYRYTTNMAVNPLTYANLPTVVHPHGTGTVWCTALWDMTWKIIEQAGISPNLFDPTATGGNVIALKLVMEGMKLQPCSPGFISGRDAILKADTLLYGGQYSCSIIEAFARRGMGVNASQGSSNSRTDQIVDFTGGLTFNLTQNVTQIPEGQNIVYTHTVNSPCTPVVNYLITDTLPLNVTYVSGGTYNPATRVASFLVNMAAGQTQNYVLTVNVNAGSYFAPITLLDEQLAAAGPAIPAGWNATSTTANAWTVHNLRSKSAPNSFFTPNAAVISDQILGTSTDVALGAAPPDLSFWHWYNSESGWDGGVVEISTNAGSTWTDLGPSILSGGYNGALDAAGGHPLSGRQAFNGNSGGFVKTNITLASFANQNARFRFRFASDASLGATGWNLDDILLQKIAVVNMRASLFTSTGTRLNFRDTVTVILESVTCNNLTITTQPANTNTCSGANATFTVAMTGTSPSYQWQESTDAGLTWTNIAGATAATLTRTAVTAGMNNYQYRVIANNPCPSTVTSSAATLNVTNSAAITSQPLAVTLCAGSNASFTTTATGSTLSYQWQMSSNAGVTWTNITGATNATLNLAAVTAAMNANQYRVVVFSCGPTGLNSSAATLTVNTPVAISAQPASIAVCEGSTVTFSTTATGSGIGYQWQMSSNGGTTWSNVAGATNTALVLSSVTVAMNSNQYRVNITGTCSPAGLNSSAAVLTVNSFVTISSQPSPVAVCAGLNTAFTITAGGTGLAHQWQVSTDAGVTWTNITGATAATLNLTAVTTAMNNNRYRSVMNGTCTANLVSSGALLTVNTPVSITTQPVNKAICRGAGTSFTVAATGTTITYQWQLSVNGGPFVNLDNNAPYSGVSSNTLTISNASMVLNGGNYRVVVSGIPCGAVNSSTAVLTVNELPGTVLAAAEYNRLMPSINSNLYTTTSPVGLYTYQWFRNTVPVIGAAASSLPINVDAFGEYTVLVTDVNGCSILSNKIMVSDSASNQLFIYPNPSSGQFQVRYYSPNNTTLGRTITVYDAKGARVYSKLYSVTRTYDRMDVNLTNLQSGVYMVELKDGSGKHIASGMVVIQ
jgi:Fungalysin metallopeptidase (M36)/Secretion system C-terminal sorting domain/Fungalysin/Thermolysin Propeptide Motif